MDHKIEKGEDGLPYFTRYVFPSRSTYAVKDISMLEHRAAVFAPPTLRGGGRAESYYILCDDVYARI